MTIDDNDVQKDLMSVPSDMNPDTIRKFSILEDLLEQGFEEDTILKHDLVQILFDGGHIPLSCPLPTKMLAIGY
jgi:hypothetical protein